MGLAKSDNTATVLVGSEDCFTKLSSRFEHMLLVPTPTKFQVVPQRAAVAQHSDLGMWSNWDLWMPPDNSIACLCRFMLLDSIAFR